MHESGPGAAERTKSWSRLIADRKSDCERASSEKFFADFSLSYAEEGGIGEKPSHTVSLPMLRNLPHGNATPFLPTSPLLIAGHLVLSIHS
jgi:hypothetical protein